MRYDTVDEVFSSNERFGSDLIDMLSQIAGADAGHRSSDTGWSAQEIAEHIAIVDTGVARICQKLLSKSVPHTDQSLEGAFSISQEFQKSVATSAGARLEAPDQVRPTGAITIADSVRTLVENQSSYQAMRADFERLDHSGPTFPHPYFGPLNAGEWLALAGLHKYRHAKQITAQLDAKIPGQKEGNPAGDETSN